MKRPTITNRAYMLNLLYRAYNAMVALTVLSQFFKKSDASPVEYLPDVAIHLWEACAPHSASKVAIGAHSLRILQAGNAVRTGVSTIPEFFNATDILNHGLCITQRVLFLFNGSNSNNTQIKSTDAPEQVEPSTEPLMRRHPKHFGID